MGKMINNFMMTRVQPRQVQSAVGKVAEWMKPFKIATALE